MDVNIEPEPTPEEREALLEALRRRQRPPEEGRWRSADDEEDPYATARPRKSRGAVRA